MTWAFVKTGPGDGKTYGIHLTYLLAPHNILEFVKIMGVELSAKESFEFLVHYQFLYFVKPTSSNLEKLTALLSPLAQCILNAAQRKFGYWQASALFRPSSSS